MTLRWGDLVETCAKCAGVGRITGNGEVIVESRRSSGRDMVGTTTCPECMGAKHFLTKQGQTLKRFLQTYPDMAERPE
jgi:hypothetical protein